MVGIISNIGASIAQSNLNMASAASQSSISRLSSGNKISRASDDVAGLAVGTILQTNVSTLQAALNNTSQANSLLGVADGALQNIGDILQRQKVLASEATSGSLTDTARGFLNQEFQNLKSQIDQISSSTNFNGINLLDGSLFKPATITTQTSQAALATSGTIKFDAAAASLVSADADTYTISVGASNVVFNCRDATTYLAGNTTPLDIDTSGTAPGFVASAGGATDAQNLMTAINNVLNSTSTTAAVVSAKNTLSGLAFAINGSSITITSKSASTEFNSAGSLAIKVGVSVASYTGAGAGSFTVNGTDADGVTNASVALSAGGTAATGDVTSAPYADGYLNSGALSSTAGVAYAGTATTVATGNINDNLLTSLTVGAAATTGANFSGVSNNAAFIGNISGFKATYTTPGFVDASVTVGGVEYTAKNINTNTGTTATIVRFSSVPNGTTPPNGGYFDLQFNAVATSGQAVIRDQAGADQFASRIDGALSGVTAEQMRQVNSYQPSGSIINSAGNTIGNLTGSNFNLYGSNFNNTQIQNIQVTAGSVSGSVQPTISFTINGEQYVSGYDSTGAANATPFTITAGPPAAISLAANATMGFRSTTNPNDLLVFRNGSAALDLTTADNANAVQTALSNAFGLNGGASGKGGSGSALTFQVGTSAADNINVQVKGASTKDIYKDATGASTTLDISTLAGATSASSILDTAINTVTAIRANVGALESRFNYAAANIQSSEQNQDAARGSFLDTDVASESTKFAAAQVKIQAGISVLAQANQLPQFLLKLL